MAWIAIEPAGTKRGPCLDCKHDDCRHARRIAETCCTYCREPIGYERQATQDREGLAHVVCLVEAIA